MTISGNYFESLHDVDDIEDIIGENDVKPKDRYKNKPIPVPKARKIKGNKPSVVQKIVNDSGIELPETEANFVDSSTAKVYVKTWGCAHNSSDSEYMAGQLAAQVRKFLINN